MQRQITVIHYVYTLFGGVASVAANIMNEQHEKGIKHLVVYKDYSTVFEEQLSFKCPMIKVAESSYPGKTMLFGINIRKYYAEYVKKHPDEIVIAHVHNIQALGAFARWNDIPLVCTLHSLRGSDVANTFRQKISGALYKYALKRLLAHGKEVTSVSSAIVKEYANFRGSEKIHVIYNGAKIDYSKREYHESFNIGHVGNLSYAKGFDTVWNAYVGLDEEFKKKIHFYCAGNEVQFTRKWLEEECAKRGMANVHYSGFVTNAQDKFIPKLDILVLASRNEGLGLVQIEAMGYGIPVLGRDTGGICEILRDGFNGYVVKNEEDLRDKIQQLFCNKREYERLSINARNTYLERFCMEVIMKQYEIVYDKVIAGACSCGRE